MKIEKMKQIASRRTPGEYENDADWFTTIDLTKLEEPEG